jgi:hypothetical protein
MDRLLFRHMVLRQPQKKIVFLAGTPRRHSFPWKIVWSETSFYIRPWLANEYEGPSWHLSFHGPSAERKPRGFRIRWDDVRKVPEGFGRVFRDLITERGGPQGVVDRARGGRWGTSRGED